MRDRTWLRKVRSLVISLAPLAALLVAGAANWPKR